MTQLLKDIRHWTSVDPTRAAVALADGFFTYQQFSDLIQQARALLHAHLGDTRSGIVSIRIEHLARAWIWTIAARSLGFDTLNADVRTMEPPPVAFITDLDGLDSSGGRGSCVYIGPDVLIGGLQRPSDLADPERVAAGSHLLLSSGTTGTPKIVEMTERQHLQSAIEQRHTLDHHRDSVVFGWVFPLQTAVGYRSPVTAWGVGACVVLHGSPKLAFGNFALTSAILTPGLLQELVNDAEGLPRRDDIRLLVTGGPVGWGLAQRARELVSADLSTMYGSTELGAVCMTPLRSEEDTFLYRPLETCQIRILDEDGLEQPRLTQGSVWVLAPNGAQAYFGDQAVTEAFFDNGWFKTGDLGLLRDDGRLEILGRANDVLVIRGDKQPSGPVERRISEALGRNVCVFSDYRSSAVGDLVVVLEGGPPTASDQLGVEQAIANIGMPFRVTSHPVFARNGMGKVMRSALISEAGLF